LQLNLGGSVRRRKGTERDLGFEVGANEVMKGFGEDKSFVEFIGLL
jgi:hypothetical protein